MMMPSLLFWGTLAQAQTTSFARIWAPFFLDRSMRFLKKTQSLNQRKSSGPVCRSIRDVSRKFPDCEEGGRPPRVEGRRDALFCPHAGVGYLILHEGAVRNGNLRKGRNWTDNRLDLAAKWRLSSTEEAFMMSVRHQISRPSLAGTPS